MCLISQSWLGKASTSLLPALVLWEYIIGTNHRGFFLSLLPSAVALLQLLPLWSEDHHHYYINRGGCNG